MITGSVRESDGMRSPFWAAFWAGLAAPTMLYAAPRPYYLYLSGTNIAVSFMAVGMGLDRVSGVYLDGGQSLAGQQPVEVASGKSAEEAKHQPDPPQAPPGQISPQLLQQIVAAQLAAAGMRPMFPGIGLPIPFAAGLPIAQLQMTWQGPYPPPEAIERYEHVLPGAFNRMIAMAEGLQEAQIREAQKANEYTSAQTRRGHYLGFATSIFAMCGAGFCVWVHQPWVAGLFLGVPLTAVARTLIAGRQEPAGMVPAPMAATAQDAPPQTVAQAAETQPA